jgi:hypothetical protein
VEQVAPCVQLVQMPDDEQTMFVPRLVPPPHTSVYTANPLEHS